MPKGNRKGPSQKPAADKSTKGTPAASTTSTAAAPPTTETTHAKKKGKK